MRTKTFTLPSFFKQFIVIGESSNVDQDDIDYLDSWIEKNKVCFFLGSEDLRIESQLDNIREHDMMDKYPKQHCEEFTCIVDD